MKERIVTNAWELVTNFPSLKKLNFLPSLFGTSWLFLILVYQIAYTTILVLKKQDDILHFIIHTLPNEPYFYSIIAGIIIVFLLYIFLSPIAKGGLIHMMHTYRQNNGEKFHRSWQWFFDGLIHFLPIFEIQNITSIFAPLTIITSTIFLFRFTDSSFHTAIGIIMGIYLLFAFLMNMCFAYAPFFAVFEWKKGTQSLSSSTTMAVNNISITARLYFTNLLLYLRVLIVGGFFLLLPFIVSSIVAYFTILEVQMFFVVIFSIISLVFFIFIVHLNSTLEIFILALWYEAYIACKEEEKTLQIEK